jgi:hypothetical protein
MATVSKLPEGLFMFEQPFLRVSRKTLFSLFDTFLDLSTEL